MLHHELCPVEHRSPVHHPVAFDAAGSACVPSAPGEQVAAAFAAVAE
jgi:hypothetical protein